MTYYFPSHSSINSSNLAALQICSTEVPSVVLALVTDVGAPFGLSLVNLLLSCSLDVTASQGAPSSGLHSGPAVAFLAQGHPQV